MASFYINTYDPLVASRAGRLASEEYGLPPFVDGSIRREPDLEHTFPSITCLCRADKFAPRLRVDDFVAYLTKKARYRSGIPHLRLTAILKVHAVLPSHAAAAKWYRTHNLALPNNCWVRGNSAKPLEHSHRKFRTSKCAGLKHAHREWDAGYRWRSAQFGTFVVCQPLFRDLSWNAPIVEDDVLVAAFGRIPGTRNPGKMTMADFEKFMNLLEIRIPPSSP